MKRREFIKQLTAAGLATGFITGSGAFFSGCAGPERSDPPGPTVPTNAPAGLGRTVWPSCTMPPWPPADITANPGASA